MPAALTLVALLAACGPRDGQFNPTNFTVDEATIPRDLAVPSNFSTTDYHAGFSGLYPAQPSELTCCWIAQTAHLLVRKTAYAKTFVAGFWVPKIPRFARGQAVTIRFDGTNVPPYRTGTMEAEDQATIKIPLPPEMRHTRGVIPVTMTCRVEYVPSRDDPPPPWYNRILRLPSSHSTDDRKLGVTLLYAYFQ